MTGSDDGAVGTMAIDRDLVRRDLDRLMAGVLMPRVEAYLLRLRAVRFRVGVGFLSRDLPVGEWGVSRLQAYLPRVSSDASAAVLTLPDGELYALAAVIAAELGAWAGQRPPLTDDELAVAGPAIAHLVGDIDELAAAGAEPIVIDAATLGES